MLAPNGPNPSSKIRAESDRILKEMSQEKDISVLNDKSKFLEWMNLQTTRIIYPDKVEDKNHKSESNLKSQVRNSSSKSGGYEGTKENKYDYECNNNNTHMFSSSSNMLLSIPEFNIEEIEQSQPDVNILEKFKNIRLQFSDSTKNNNSNNKTQLLPSSTTTSTHSNDSVRRKSTSAYERPKSIIKGVISPPAVTKYINDESHEPAIPLQVGSNVDITNPVKKDIDSTYGSNLQNNNNSNNSSNSSSTQPSNIPSSANSSSIPIEATTSLSIPFLQSSSPPSPVRIVPILNTTTTTNPTTATAATISTTTNDAPAVSVSTTVPAKSVVVPTIPLNNSTTSTSTNNLPSSPASSSFTARDSTAASVTAALVPQSLAEATAEYRRAVQAYNDILLQEVHNNNNSPTIVYSEDYYYNYINNNNNNSASNSNINPDTNNNSSNNNIDSQPLSQSQATLSSSIPEIVFISGKPTQTTTYTLPYHQQQQTIPTTLAPSIEAKICYYDKSADTFPLTINNDSRINSSTSLGWYVPDQQQQQQQTLNSPDIYNVTFSSSSSSSLLPPTAKEIDSTLSQKPHPPLSLRIPSSSSYNIMTTAASPYSTTTVPIASAPTSSNTSTSSTVNVIREVDLSSLRTRNTSDLLRMTNNNNNQQPNSSSLLSPTKNNNTTSVVSTSTPKIQQSPHLNNNIIGSNTPTGQSSATSGSASSSSSNRSSHSIHDTSRSENSDKSGTNNINNNNNNSSKNDINNNYDYRASTFTHHAIGSTAVRAAIATGTAAAAVLNRKVSDSSFNSHNTNTNTNTMSGRNRSYTEGSEPAGIAFIDVIGNNYNNSKNITATTALTSTSIPTTSAPATVTTTTSTPIPPLTKPSSSPVFSTTSIAAATSTPTTVNVGATTSTSTRTRELDLSRLSLEDMKELTGHY